MAKARVSINSRRHVVPPVIVSTLFCFLVFSILALNASGWLKSSRVSFSLYAKNESFIRLSLVNYQVLSCTFYLLRQKRSNIKNDLIFSTANQFYHTCQCNFYEFAQLVKCFPLIFHFEINAKQTTVNDIVHFPFLKQAIRLRTL